MASLRDKVDLNIIFTGIVSYVPSSGGPCKCSDEVRFVMPNTRGWRISQNNPAVRIPPHHPFLIVRERDVAFDTDWKGQPPTGRLFDKWVYWILNNDNIRIDGLDKTGVRYGDTSRVVNLSELCPEAGISEQNIREDSPRVGARVVLTAGRLSQRSVTNEKYEFLACGERKVPAQFLADEVQVAIKNVKLKYNELVLKRLRLNDNKAARRPIILRPRVPLMKIFFGSAPEADLGAVVGRTFNHEHGSTNLHFELHYDMSARTPYPPIPVPILAKPGEETGGPIGGGDRCPPTTGGTKPPGT